MIRKNKHTGSVLILLIAVLPLYLWLSYVGIESVTSSNARVVASLGKATALVGTALYLLTPILSTRLKITESIFGGLDRVYKAHSKTAKLSLLLIILHPILLGTGRMIRGNSFIEIWDWTGIVVILGLVSLFVMLAVTILTIYSHIKHQKWIIIHRIFGWLIILFMAHGLLANSQLVNNIGLLIFFLSLATLSFSAFLYRSVFGKWLVKKYPYIICEVNNYSKTNAEVVLKPLAMPITYKAGQFAYLSFKHPEIDPEAHPYSFSNANNGDYVRFTIKELGDDTKKIKNIQIGTKAWLEGPYGRFDYLSTKNKKQVWIAGGIGIAPFLSMARSFSGNDEHEINFFYGTDSLDEAVFLQEFLDVTRHLPEQFKAHVVSKDLSGFVTIEMLNDALSDLKDNDYFICGPPGMMKILKKQLADAGVKKKHIHTEEFGM